MHMRRKARTPQTSRGGVEQVIFQALSKDRAQHFNDVRRFAQVLQEASQAATALPGGPAPATASASPVRLQNLPVPLTRCWDASRTSIRPVCC